MQVSMNHIAQYKGVRLYQTGYSEVSNASALTVNSDPYGIAITYVGYGILFVSLIAMLVRRNGMFRALLRNPLLKKNLFVLFLLLCPTLSLSTKAQNTIPKDCAKQLGEVWCCIMVEYVHCKHLHSTSLKRCMGHALIMVLRQNRCLLA